MDDWLADWMEDWARWTMAQTGYSKDVILARMMAGQLGFAESFGGSIPVGVIPPTEVATIQRAHNGLMHTENGKAVVAHKTYWTIGGGDDGYEAVMELMQCGNITARTLIDKGAHAMRGYIKALRDEKRLVEI